MSKWKQIAKTRRLKMKNSPVAKLERITELKRMLKHYKTTLPAEEKKAKEWERNARSARWQIEYMKSEIQRMQNELTELEAE